MTRLVAMAPSGTVRAGALTARSASPLGTGERASAKSHTNTSIGSEERFDAAAQVPLIAG